MSSIPVGLRFQGYLKNIFRHNGLRWRSMALGVGVGVHTAGSRSALRLPA